MYEVWIYIPHLKENIPKDLINSKTKSIKSLKRKKKSSKNREESTQNIFKRGFKILKINIYQNKIITKK